MNLVALFASIVLVFAAPAIGEPAVESEVLEALAERTDVLGRARGLSAIEAATRACEFRRVLPYEDLKTIRVALAEMNEELYIRGSQEGALAVKRRQHKPGSLQCRHAVPHIQRGTQGILGFAQTLRSFGFD